MAIRAIDQKRGGMANEGHFYERKIALLAKEDQIEADFEKMVPPFVETTTPFYHPLPSISHSQSQSSSQSCFKLHSIPNSLTVRGRHDRRFSKFFS